MSNVIYIDSLYGNDGWSGAIDSPLKTLPYAISAAKAGSELILQRGTGASYGGATIPKNLTIRGSYGNTSVEVGSLVLTEAQCLFEGLAFRNLTTGISVTNSFRGASSIKSCVFDNVETSIDLKNVNYIGIHRNFFKDHKYGVKIYEAEEVNVSSNIFTSGFRSIDINTVQRLDVWRNTIWGAADIGSVGTPDENLRVIYRVLSADDIAKKTIGLPGFAYQNTYGYDVAVNVVNGPSFQYGVDYEVIKWGQVVSWDGLRLEQEFAQGDLIRIMYAEDVDPGGGNAVSVLNTGDTNSRIDSNNITGKATDIDLGVFFNSPLKIRYNNFYQTTDWYNGAVPSNNEGNFSSDPKYTDPGNDDFRLQSTSPDIDRGDPTRWDDILGEMGFGETNGEYYYLGSHSRENVAPFNRDIDITGVHRSVLSPTGDVGAYEYNLNEGSLGNHVAEDGYDFAYPGTESQPYGTIDRGYRRVQTDDLYIKTNVMPYESGGDIIDPSTSLYNYGRYRSKNIELNNAGVYIGDNNTERDIALIYPSYPSYTTGAVYVSLDGDDTNDGSKGTPFRTIERALQEAADSVFVEPGIYPAFDGVNGKKLIGLEKISQIPFTRGVYSDFTLGTWITAGDVYISRMRMDLTDISTALSGFNFSSDIELKTSVDVGADGFTILLQNASNNIKIYINKVSSQMVISYLTDGSTYEFYYPLSGGPSLYSGISIGVKFINNKVQVRASNADIDEVISFNLGTGYTDPWTLSFENSGTGLSSAYGIYQSAATYTGVSALYATYTGRKVFGIKGLES